MRPVSDDWSDSDREAMARALELATRGLYTTDPNPRVGCVLRRDGRVVGEGWHARAGEPHAEVLALRAAGGDARGATAYVSLEPCSHTGRTGPCADALIAAGVTRVVCALRDPNPRVAGGGLQRLEAAGIAVVVGLMAAEARALNPGFLSRFERGRPFVRLKLAMSLDGRTAPAGGTVQRWLTGDAARADVQTLRARSSAVLTGAGTVRVDDPRLDVRLDYGPWIRQPMRVVLDPDFSCPPTARIFDAGGSLTFAGRGAAPRDAKREGQVDTQRQVDAEPQGRLMRPDRPERRIVRVSRSPRGLDLHEVLEHLNRLEVNELLVECGARLAAGFLAEKLVDELIVYVAPSFLGTAAAPLAALSVHELPGMPDFAFSEQRLIGNDLRVVLTTKKV